MNLIRRALDRLFRAKTPPIAGPGLYYAEQAQRLVNRERYSLSIHPLKLVVPLSRDAQATANRLADNARDDREGRTAKRLATSGYPCHKATEVIGSGHDTAADAVGAWLSGRRERAVLLNREWHEMGVGVASAKDGRWYWVAVFADPAGD